MKASVRLRVRVDERGLHVARSWWLRLRAGSLAYVGPWRALTGAPAAGRYEIHAVLDEAGDFLVCRPVEFCVLAIRNPGRPNVPPAPTCWAPEAWEGRRVSVVVRWLGEVGFTRVICDD